MRTEDLIRFRNYGLQFQAIQFFHSLKIVCSADLDIQYFAVGRSPMTSNFIVEMDQILHG